MQPKNLTQALLIAEAHCRASGLPHMSPTAYCRGETTAGLLPWSKLSAKDVLPGTKFRAGASTVEIMQIIRKLNVGGMTVVLITHEPDIAYCAKRVLRMRDGLFVKEETVTERLDLDAELIKLKTASKTQAEEHA